jgi:hypothetical protein
MELPEIGIVIQAELGALVEAKTATEASKARSLSLKHINKDRSNRRHAKTFQQMAYHAMLRGSATRREKLMESR